MWCLEFLGKDVPSPIHELIKKYKLEKQVHFLSRTDDTLNIFRRKSVYGLSSRNEGFHNSLEEAKSQGCTCLAFDCQTGPKEIISDGESGILIENGSIEDMAKKLNTLLSDEKLRSYLSKNAVEEVKRFDISLIMKQWDNVIEQVNGKEKILP